MQKCHSIIVTGKVQDIGFRSVVEHIGRKLDKANLLLKSGFDNVNTGLTDIKSGIDNVNTGLTDIKSGLNNLTTMMYEHNTRLEAILEKLANKPVSP